MPLSAKETTHLAGILLTLLLALVAFADTLHAELPGRLFDSHQLLRLTLRAPLQELVKTTETHPELEGSITLEDEHSIPVTVKIFGKTRVEYCNLPPLALTPDPEATRGTLFEGRRVLRIVTHCGYEAGSDRWVVLEYLAYRIFQILSETSLSVRLAEIEYHDSSAKGRPRMAHAFFVEDINLAAQRRGLEWLDIHPRSPKGLDSQQMAVLALFQYMVGNTDWSAIDGPEGERCCHNAALIGRQGATDHRLLPYDFDQSGLVKAPYSQPSHTLGLRDVRQRRYRGFCDHNDVLPKAIDVFNQRRASIEALLLEPSLPHPGARKEALRYLEGFYREINDAKLLNKKLLKHCRQPGKSR
jgi:hypothetical protein